MSKPNFVHLHVHSHYSLLDGLGKVNQLVSRAKELGMPALGLTDHGVMHGAIDFYLECQKAGLKPIIGQEAYVAPRQLSDKAAGTDNKSFHLLLLAKNFQGYKNLIKLTSIAHLEGYYYKPRIDHDTLSRYSEGLIASSACLASETSQRLLNGDHKGAEEVIGFYRETFGKDNYYLELQDHPGISEQQLVNQKLKDLATKMNLPLIATNDVHYVNAEDHQSHDVLVCVQTGKLVSDTNRMLYTGDFSLKDPVDMAKAFADVPEAISNTLKIADMVNLEIPLGQELLPKFPLPAGESEASLLRKWSEAGLPKRYPKITDEIRRKLEFELDVITKSGFSGYFLIVADLINYAKSQGIFVGPGRGSAVGSLVSYVLGITNVDPLEYGLLFERFLNPDRISMPDIDIDFEDKRRGEVIDYVVKKYGADHVAGIITFGTIMARAAVRDVGRVLGLPYNQVDAIAKTIPTPIQGRHVPLAKSVQETPELAAIYQKDPEAKQVLDQAIKLEGTIRHASQHACAIVISKEPLDNYVAVQAAQGGDVHQVTQYSMEPIEKIGLLKMDFLGLANLTILRETCEIIEAVYGDKINIENIALDDPKTFKLFGRGETTGVFQLECLSGKTIISNTTVENLYRKQDKQKLESVYLDEGKVHKNKILAVVACGKKRTYNLVAENGWYITASQDHHFLTDNGWKKLAEIKPGEKVLMKTKAKHLIFNHCLSCGKQIDGQREGKSEFCYRCSALHYKNPSKIAAREKIRQSRLAFYEKGGRSWNEGLTSETNEKVRSIGKKISTSLTGKTWEMRLGEEKAQAFRQVASLRMQGSNNHMFGRAAPHRKGGYREDLGHYVRSSWEADFARILKLHQLEYQYEPTTFSLRRLDGSILHYTPDFFVKEHNTYYEIKGWLHSLDEEKMQLFRQQYPQLKLEMISATKFAELALKYKQLIKWECPRVPVKQSFEFVPIREIVEAGEEETYDIMMEAPGNNFVANGFVVHNSSGMKRYIKELQPNRFEDIIAMVALYRPGPMQWIQSFINRKNGKEGVSYLHPLAENSLKETYGIPVYQEQVMRMSKDMCGFTGSEADTLRKAIGKKNPKLMKEMKDKFVEGAVKNGVGKVKAEEIFKQLEDFAAYCFNKSHATCYALIAYQTAYLKANYPDCFMAALMTSDINNMDRLSIEISESERLGLTVLPPDVNESFSDFGVIKDKKAIRFGLSAIKNVGSGVARAIVSERKANGSFTSLTDFLRRNSATLNKKVLESLVKSGALDCLESRANLYAGLELLVKYAAEANKHTNGHQADLFGGTAKTEAGLQLPAGQLEKREILAWEKELLGLYLSEHPLKEYQEKLQELATPLNELTEQQANQVVRVGGIVHELKKITTKSNQSMAFAQIEDAHGSIEAVVFPNAFASLSALWQIDQPVLIQGRISNKDGALKIIVDQAWDLEETLSGSWAPPALSNGRANGSFSHPRSTESTGPSSIKKSQPQRYIIELPAKATRSMIEQLRTTLQQFPGDKAVELRVTNNGSTKSLPTKLQVELSPKLEEAVAQIIQS